MVHSSIHWLTYAPMYMQVSNEPSEEAIKGTLDYLHEKAKSSTSVAVTEPDAVRPMMEVRKHADKQAGAAVVLESNEGGKECV